MADNDSILICIKKLVGGIEPDVTHFDTDIIIHINSVMLSLNQLGVGPDDGFMITGDEETWDDFIEDKPILQAVKTYIGLKVKLLFDPPSTSFVLEAYERQIKELEWRINTQVDKPVVEEVVSNEQ